MKEFDYQTGGRFTYIEDIFNLQELSLAFTSLFDGCDNFIVAGCEVDGDTITSGMVYLNGKLRMFGGAKGVSEWPQYIYEENTTEKIPYVYGGSKVGRKVWGCKLGSSVPIAPTPLTDKAPQSIKIAETGGLRMKDAWLGRYALICDAGVNQSVKGKVAFGDISAQQVSANSMSIKSGNGETSMSFSDGAMVLETIASAGRDKYRLTVSPYANGFQFSKNGSTIASMTESNIYFNQPIIGAQSTFGQVRITGNQIFNSASYSDDGELLINMVGPSADVTHYRNTVIGDGRGNALIKTIGKDAKINLFGQVVVDSSSTDGITLQTQLPKNNPAQKKLIRWQDSNKADMAYMGYAVDENQVFFLQNSLASVRVTGVGFVDIEPSIKEGGVFLSDKYASLNGGFTQFIQSSGVSKAELCAQIGAITSDELTFFAKVDSYLSDMATTEANKQKIRNNIGAVGFEDLSQTAKIQNCLSDMATDERKQQEIRNNIGAVGFDDLKQLQLNDTGWVEVTRTGLYARQIGNTVHIQGVVMPAANGTLFTLPNNIDPPSQSVGLNAATSDGGALSCSILLGSKQCSILRCTTKDTVIPFNLTYLI